MKQQRPREFSMELFSHNKQEIAQPLLARQEQVVQKFRTINVSKGTKICEPINTKIKNTICNQKYSILSFVPKVLYDQFKYFANMFYLLTALSQFVPALSVGLLFSFVAPLVFVLFLTMLKQAYQDYQRYLKDKQANSAVYNILTPEGYRKVESDKLRVGDIIEVSVGERVPADILLIHTTDENGAIFIKTDQLDGQTDWKLRKPIKHLQQLVNRDQNSINNVQFKIQYKQPTINIYKFEALYQSHQVREGLNLQHTAWAGVKLACNKVLGIIIYIGKDMKMPMNIKQPQTKFGRLDQELNLFSKLLFLLMLFLSFLLLLMKGMSGSTFQQEMLLFTKYFLLLSSIIPISMRVNLDFAKLIYSRNINVDRRIPDTAVRNSNIPEDLGRIEYILSDKTGTLTKNQMVFKKLVLDQSNQIESNQIQALRAVIKNQCQLEQGPYPDYNPDKRTQKRMTERLWRDLVTALIICHNVTPVIEENQRVLQGSSPDQVALVKLAETIGFRLEKRTQVDMKIVNPADIQENYQILYIFPFSSERKRMGIIIRHVQTNRYLFYLKGADVVIGKKLIESKAHFMIEACTDLASEGLRTLAICYKYLNQREYLKWKQEYQNAKIQINHREARQNEVIEKLEKGMEFLGITGVQDKLQDQIRETISSLRGASINIWMLTGDKIETAICIAVSTQIKSKEQKLMIIQEASSSSEFRASLNTLYQNLKTNKKQLQLHTELFFKDILIIIDGTSLKQALSQQFQKQFFQVASRFPSLVCSRCSPTQKAQITERLKRYTNKKVLAIGDGGNDVGMIQSADVGIGIYGKQGIQAALASDFSITEFKNLKNLLLWHGRMSYKRSCSLAQFVIHRGIIISIMQAIFIAIFYFVAIPIFNGLLMLGYTTIFTALPIFSLIFDEDITIDVALRYPELYKKIQEGKELNLFTFTYWMFVSIYQGAVIMILIFVIFKNNSFYLVTTISLTCLIYIEFLNIFTSIHRLHVIHLVSTLLSALVYFFSIFFMRNYLNGSEIIAGENLYYTVVIVAASWLPPFLYKYIKKYLNPSDEERVMKEEKTRLIQFRIQ